LSTSFCPHLFVHIFLSTSFCPHLFVPLFRPPKRGRSISMLLMIRKDEPNIFIFLLK
jgi:hypothetical protein